MPQFDIITFFLQTFWLLIIFFGFYVLIVHGFVPKLATALKTRKKKLDGGASGVSALNKEQLLITASKNTLIQITAGNSKNNINSMLTKSIDWLFTGMSFSNERDLFISNSSYLKKSASTIAKQHSSIKKS